MKNRYSDSWLFYTQKSCISCSTNPGLLFIYQTWSFPQRKPVKIPSSESPNGTRESNKKFTTESRTRTRAFPFPQHPTGVISYQSMAGHLGRRPAYRGWVRALLGTLGQSPRRSLGTTSRSLDRTESGTVYTKWFGSSNTSPFSTPPLPTVLAVSSVIYKSGRME